MTNSKAREKGKKELIEVFQALGFYDGLAEDIPNDKFVYYYNKARNGQIGNYIIFETIDSAEVCRADDVVLAREFFCQIDIFSVNSFESKKLKQTIASLEEKLGERLFGVDMKEDTFEPDTKLYHLILIVSKAYFY
jgi:hypothetical protein